MKANLKKLLRLGVLCGLLLFRALALPQAIALEDAEDRSLAAMCKRGLSASAILYAESQRQIASESSRQAKWTMRIMECHALAALNSSPQSEQGREAVALHWEMPARIYKDFANQQPSNPRLPWLAWQASRCDLLHAQYTLARYLAVPSDTEIRETTLALVRSIMSQTESLLDDIRRRQPLAARGGRDGGAEAPVEQLAKLAVDTSLLQCEALLVRARLYEPGSPDRIAAATEVETRAAEVVTRAAEDWSALEKLTIARAVAQFELGGSETALLVLEGLARKSSDTQTRMRAAVLAIERLASGGESSRAQPLLSYLEQLGESPELAIARMQVSLSELATIPEESRERALRELVGNAKSIGREFGDYWRNRADALLVGSVSSGSAGGASVSLDLMLVEVRQLLAADNLDGAVQKLMQFRDNESTAGRGESAIQLASQAAALLNREQRWAEAIAAVEPTILKFDQARNAAEAHMLVVWARTQMLRGNTESADLKTAYEDSLRKQLAAWPDAEVTDEAEQWLADWFIGGGRRGEFIAALHGRIRASTDVGIARAAGMRWLEQVLALDDASEVPACLQAIRNEEQPFAQPEVQFSAKLAAHVAESFVAWPSASRQKQFQAERAKLRPQVKDPAVGQLVVAADLLDAFREQKINQAESLSGNFGIGISRCGGAGRPPFPYPNTSFYRVFH